MLEICDINDVNNIQLGQHTTHKSLKRECQEDFTISI